MRGFCATHPRRASRRRAAAWRLCLMLILILGAAVSADFAPTAARAASRDLYSELGGGSLTGDPDDGEHVTGPLAPAISTTPDPTATTYSQYTIAPSPSSEVFLLPSGRFATLRALIRSARPLAWLALSARQPWACDPLWLMTAMADPTRAPITLSGRTR